ncbi:hypothetical protein ACMFMF_001912 [Clarireedia jacksonii]
MYHSNKFFIAAAIFAATVTSLPMSVEQRAIPDIGSEPFIDPLGLNKKLVADTANPIDSLPRLNDHIITDKRSTGDTTKREIHNIDEPADVLVALSKREIHNIDEPADVLVALSKREIHNIDEPADVLVALTKREAHDN